jgi:hypothetical protein
MDSGKKRNGQHLVRVLIDSNTDRSIMIEASIDNRVKDHRMWLAHQISWAKRNGCIVEVARTN